MFPHILPSAVIVSMLFLCISFPLAYRKYEVLLREFVSRNAAGKGKAVLEYVGLSAEERNMVYANNPRDEEQAVQEGLLKWTESRVNTTWKVLVDAMRHAGIAVQYINKLKEELQKGACAFLYVQCHVYISS